MALFIAAMLPNPILGETRLQETDLADRSPQITIGKLESGDAQLRNALLPPEKNR